jgi:hypothetical protein
MGNICCTSHRRQIVPKQLPSFLVTIWNSDRVGYCELRFNFMYVSNDEQTIAIDEFSRVSDAIKVKYTINHSKQQGIVLAPYEEIESIKQSYKSQGLLCSYRDLRTPTSSPR